MSEINTNKKIYEYLKVLQLPYAVFEKNGNDIVLSDSNDTFNKYFEINEDKKFLSEIFSNQYSEVKEILDGISDKEKMFIYNNKTNKCFEFHINYIENKYHFLANDCTEIQNIKTAWSKSEALYKSIFNSGTQAIVFLEKDSKIIAFNSYADVLAKKVLNIELKINRKIIDILPEDELDNFTTHFSDALENKKIIIERHKDIKDSHKKEWFELQYQSINDISVGISGVSVTINNITERKRYEQEMKDLITALKLSNKITDENIQHIQSLNEELEQSETELLALNAKKDKFFSIIAHDLKNPFQGFIGLTKDLADNFQKFNLEELNEYFSTLHGNAKDLFKLIENLLLWSRVQRDSIDYEPEVLNLHDLIRLNIDIQRVNIFNKELQVFNQVNKNIEVFADLNMLNTIFRNLLSNAVKFTPKKGEISFNAIPKGDEVIVEVQDTGVGIDEETKNKLFRIDTQITTKGTNEESGTGLGLILCQELVEKNKGNISVESKLGKGTKFIFTLQRVLNKR